MERFELQKYRGKWAVYSTESRTFDFIGAGKRFCERKVKELNSRKRLYTDEQIDEAIEVIRKRTKEVLQSLGKSRNLIAYMIDPHRTAIGGFNDDVFAHCFYENVVCRENLAYDGNAGFTLLDLAEMIKNGEI